MSPINLYLSPGACSLAAHILLHETGLPFNTTTLDVAKGFPKSFAHVNPKLRVPVLVVDDQTITELPAILLAISQLQPDAQLMGSTDLERARILEWLCWLSGTLHGQAYGGLIRSARFSDDPSTHGAIKAKAAETVRGCHETIEGKLEGVHAVGGRFTAVDAFLYVFYRWGKLSAEQAKYPKYTALVEELKKRQALQDAVRDEGIDGGWPSL